MFRVNKNNNNPSFDCERASALKSQRTKRERVGKTESDRKRMKKIFVLNLNLTLYCFIPNVDLQAVILKLFFFYLFIELTESVFIDRVLADVNAFILYI